HKPVERLELDKSFVRHGGDSLSAVGLLVACRRLGVQLSLASVLGGERLSDLLLDCKGVGHQGSAGRESRVLLNPSNPGPPSPPFCSFDDEDDKRMLHP